MARKKLTAIGIAMLALAMAADAHAVRIKDVATIEGVRTNKLVGYGLVVGLQKSGDGNSVKFTKASISNMLENMGVTVSPNDVKSGNAASVMVTAELPAFARQGMNIDVSVSSIGDAKSLQGGTLLLTPLKGSDGQIYAVAQGAVSVGGFAAEGAGDSVTKNHPTVGSIPSGAIVERDLPYEFNTQGDLRLTLGTGDFTTVAAAAASINEQIGATIAQPLDSRTIRVQVPEAYRQNVVTLMAQIENIDISTDRVAKVVVNEKTGTVVMGANVRISTIAISHGNLHVRIRSTQNVSQPAPLSGGRTVVTTQGSVSAVEDPGQLFIVEAEPTIGDLVRALNAVGVTPRDLVAILQSIKSAGALEAQLEII